MSAPNHRTLERRRKLLNAMPEHQALHLADDACCNILDACIALTELYALNPLDIDAEAKEIHDAVTRLHDKLAAAHKRYDDGDVN